MSLAVISHHDCLLHEIAPQHPEQPARIQVIDNALANDPINATITRIDAPLVTQQQLLRVHSQTYIDSIFESSPTTGVFYLDPDTSMNPYTLVAAQRAAGALVHALDLVMSQKFHAAFCNVRPPGHHATHNQAMGFCFFNNVCVGAAHALEAHGLKRVAIVDFDVHHGNGTEDIFKNDERVMLCSSFQHPFYPFCGADTHSSHILNLPLPAGTASKAYREKVSHYWLNALRSFAPEMIFFSAGFDAYYEDPLAELYLLPEDYAWLTAQVKQIALEVCNGRMISTLEGGYHLSGLAQCALAHIKNLI